MPNKELQLRIISGIVLLGLAYLYVFHASEYVFVGITCFIGLLAIIEYSRGLRAKDIQIPLMTLIILHLLAFGGLWLYIKPELELLNYAQGALMMAGIILIVESILKPKKVKNAFLWQLLPLIWITIPFFSIILLRFGSDFGPLFICFVILTAAVNDTFAYLGGKKFGKTPLAKSISPNKTIEGSLFGLVGALLASQVMAHFWFPFLSPVITAVIAVGLTVVAQAGDLLESKFKRFCGIKDSGKILPGHGGILDRFDAYLTSLPLFWVAAYFLGYSFI